MSQGATISILLCGFLFSAVSPLSSQTPGGSLQEDAKVAGNASAAKPERVDVCALLTSAEIEAVQGEAIKETKPSEQHGGSFLLSQCFFRTANFAKSVNLAMATPDPAKPSALSPREYWQKQFHPSEPEKGEEEKPAVGKTPQKAEPEREREPRRPPLAIDGLGEEAYWVGNPITGALYVLKGEVFLRISVGGVSDESARIEKSKALARSALRRF